MNAVSEVISEATRVAKTPISKRQRRVVPDGQENRSQPPTTGAVKRFGCGERKFGDKLMVAPVNAADAHRPF